MDWTRVVCVVLALVNAVISVMCYLDDELDKANLYNTTAWGLIILGNLG